MFADYAPLSWVVSGFAGLLAYVIAVAIYGYGSSKVVRAKYDSKFMLETGGVDPMSRVFEDKRIFLNDFILPSSPFVDGKTFVDCDIVGPANIFLQVDNAINNIKPGIIVDAVVLDGETPFNNGFIFRNCTFRGCRFHRVTLFFAPDEALANSHLKWLNWITEMPRQEALPGTVAASQIEDQSRQSHQGNEEKTQR
ncbi:hypothetical protein [Actibacterium sp. MT2.3-13A]|uniref:hypothetical protein n=1 Tax=Actibacterium sp. MT2.3-13A TaxID=2828332 RepID=UPI001BA75554|nr:hypothetical protein [Actibacterium sp. MT2.3-13A]